MLNSHYQNELAQLRRLANEFAQTNPALAPLLGIDSASDPDVERLLEGVAFLTGMVRQRLDDESFGVLSSNDSRFGDEGFTFTLSPEDVDTKVTFMCELIV